MKFLRLTTNILTFTPYIFPAVLLSYVIRATIYLGHIPSYNQPDPKDMNFPVHHEIVGWSFEVSFLGIILYIVAALLSLCLRSRITLDYAVIFITGLGIAVIATFGPFFEWYID